MFDEEGDHFVANIKFVKSPTKDSPSRLMNKLGTGTSRSPGRSGSPGRNKGVFDGVRGSTGTPEKYRQQIVRPSRPPVPVTKNRSISRDKDAGRN